MLHKVYDDAALEMQINEFVLSNLDNPELKGELIAKALKVNRMFVHRKLKTIYNQNARDFIKTQRITLSKELLINTDLSIKAIAEKVGYSDISYFSKVFKRQVGCSPLQYRKREL